MTDVNPTSDPFLAWLETGTTRPEVVTLFADQEALAIVADLEKEQTKLQIQLDTMADGGDSPVQRALGEKPAARGLEEQIAELQEQIEQTYARIDRSRSVWTLRPLTQDEVEQIDADLPLPFMPTPTQEEQTSAKAKARFEAKMRQWQSDVGEVKRQRLQRQIVKAVVSVEFPTQTVTSVTVEQLERMFEGTHGGARFRVLNAALDRAMTMREAPARPLSSTPSGSDPA